MEFLKKLGVAKLAILGSISTFVLILLLFLAVRMSGPTMGVLYTDLSSDDTTLITAKLSSMNVPFTSDVNGSVIKVPVDRVLNLRLTFAQEGIPTSGNVVGYEIFDRSESLGTSQFVHNIKPYKSNGRRACTYHNKVCQI